MVLPAGSIVTNIVIGNQNEELINNDILLFPTQPPRDWKTPAPFIAPNVMVYNSSNEFPPAAARILSCGHIKNQTF